MGQHDPNRENVMDEWDDCTIPGGMQMMDGLGWRGRITVGGGRRSLHGSRDSRRLPGRAGRTAIGGEGHCSGNASDSDPANGEEVGAFAI